MSLRSRILALYVALALIPMLVVGVGNYVQAMRSLTDLVHAKLEAASDHGALEIAARQRELRSSLVLLSQSAYAERLFATDPESGPAPGALPWRDVWSLLGPAFESIEFRDGRGAPVEVARSPLAAGALSGASCAEVPAGSFEVRVPILMEGDAGPRGELVGRVRGEALIPEEVMRGWFGRNGQRLLVHRETGGIVFDARCATGQGKELRTAVADWTWTATQAGRGKVSLREGGIEKVGSFVEAAGVPWLVVSLADMEEFTGQYRQEQLLYLLFVGFVVTAAGGAFVILAQEVMGSLEELTTASERIGEGELTPWLPPPGPDEVGRLSQAFSTMLARIKAMMRQNEVARRLAVAGEVAAQLSHEIRNPLSSIRLNLQSLERETSGGSVPSDLSQVLGLCLREIDRLDDAVGSVLELGQPRPPEFGPCSLAGAAEDSLDVVAARLRARSIDVRVESRAQSDRVRGDEGQLRGVFLNLYLNAIDAMPSGGVLRVWSEDGAGGGEVRVHVKDSGEGVRPELRHLVFEPFFTTKAEGSGIGLTVARQTVEAHGGRLYLANGDGQNGPGAEFVVALPVAPTPEPAAGIGRWSRAHAGIEGAEA